MKKQSAGILMYRSIESKIEVLLVHPGGPFWKNKDAGTWSIPKGEFETDEDPLAAAIREFAEETGQKPSGKFNPLTTIKQKSGKLVHAWAVEGNIDEEKIISNFFEIEWPPRSGKKQSFPEIDKAGWFSFETAAEKILPAQLPLLTELSQLLSNNRKRHEK